MSEFIYQNARNTEVVCVCGIYNVVIYMSDLDVSRRTGQ